MDLISTLESVHTGILNKEHFDMLSSETLENLVNILWLSLHLTFWSLSKVQAQ